MIKKLYGFGRTIKSISKISSYNSENDDVNYFSSRGAIPIGKGSSYGDSSLNSGGTVINVNSLNTIEIDVDSRIALVGAGATLAELENQCVKHGLFPFVVPGTGLVTVGGAIASDIHGKSHHKEGSFSNFVNEIQILLSSGEILNLKPNDSTSEYFWATVGGMGLTGLILKAELRLKKIETPYVQCTEVRVQTLKQMLDVFKEFDREFEYTVAWLDLSGKFKGRGKVCGANHVGSINNLAGKKSKNQRNTFRIRYPFSFGIVNSLTISVFNKIWYIKPLKNNSQHIQKFMHPLDTVINWNKIYGKNGFVQYQFVIPFTAEAVLFEIIHKLKEYNCKSSLSVLKTLGPESSSYLSFPLAGWTLAIDFPNSKRKLDEILVEIDHLVVSCGGRIYLCKDSRMSSELVPKMYLKINEWRTIRNQMDPNNKWRSDQSRRLKLC